MLGTEVSEDILSSSCSSTNNFYIFCFMSTILGVCPLVSGLTIWDSFSSLNNFRSVLQTRASFWQRTICHCLYIWLAACIASKSSLARIMLKHWMSYISKLPRSSTKVSILWPLSFSKTFSIQLFLNWSNSWTNIGSSSSYCPEQRLTSWEIVDPLSYPDAL